MKTKECDECEGHGVVGSNMPSPLRMVETDTDICPKCYENGLIEDKSDSKTESHE